MEHFAGLDVSVKDTSVCIVDSTGKIIREVKVASEPDTLLAVLRSTANAWWGWEDSNFQPNDYQLLATKCLKCRGL